MRKKFRECKSGSAGVAAFGASFGEDHVGLVKQGRTSRAMACGPEACQGADRRLEQAKCKLASDQAESFRKVALPLLSQFVRQAAVECCHQGGHATCSGQHKRCKRSMLHLQHTLLVCADLFALMAAIHSSWWGTRVCTGELV